MYFFVTEDIAKVYFEVKIVIKLFFLLHQGTSSVKNFFSEFLSI